MTSKVKCAMWVWKTAWIGVSYNGTHQEIEWPLGIIFYGYIDDGLALFEYMQYPINNNKRHYWWRNPCGFLEEYFFSVIHVQTAESSLCQYPISFPSAKIKKKSKQKNNRPDHLVGFSYLGIY